MKKILVLIIILFPVMGLSGDNISTLKQCLPDLSGADFNGPINRISYDTLKSNYTGNDFPSRTDWAICKRNAEVKRALTSKKEELTTEALSRIYPYMPYASYEEAYIAYQNWLSIAPAAMQATANKQAAIDHVIVLLSERAALSNYTGMGSIDAYNPENAEWP